MCSPETVCMPPCSDHKWLLLSRRLPQQLQAPLPRRIDINPHSNQTLLEHAPVEWNFLLNKVLLTQLPAPWAQAELSSSGSRSTLMNPLKYRLIGIAALALAEPVIPQTPLGSPGHSAWKPSVASPPTLIPAPSPRSNWMFCGLRMRRWQWGIEGRKLLFLFCVFFLTRLQFVWLLRMGQKKDKPIKKKGELLCHPSPVPAPCREDCEAPFTTLKVTQEAIQTLDWDWIPTKCRSSSSAA